MCCEPAWLRRPLRFLWFQFWFGARVAPAAAPLFVVPVFRRVPLQLLSSISALVPSPDSLRASLAPFGSVVRAPSFVRVLPPRIARTEPHPNTGVRTAFLDPSRRPSPLLALPCPTASLVQLRSPCANPTSVPRGGHSLESSPIRVQRDRTYAWGWPGVGWAGWRRQFDVLAVIRPRRDSIRRLLVERHWHRDDQSGPAAAGASAQEEGRIAEMRQIADAAQSRC